MMKINQIKRGVGLLLAPIAFALVTTSCEDVEIDNLNDPELTATLSNADDYPATLNGAYYSWWNALHKYDPYMTLSVAADHGTSSWGNFNMREVGTVSEPYGLGDHSALNNTQSAPSVAYLETPWYQLYSSITTANNVLRGINIDGNLVNDDAVITEQTVGQAQFIRGLSYGYLALLFDQGFLVTEDTDISGLNGDSLVDYNSISAQAIQDLREMISIAQGNSSFSIPQFNGVILSQSQAIALANSYIAKFLAQTPRTASESDSVDWTDVRDAAANGISTTFGPLGDGGTQWWSAYFLHANPGWIRLDQKLVNMVDSSQPFPFPASGAYDVDPESVPDDRFGTDVTSDFLFAGSPPFRADRGTYFFSYWQFNRYAEYRSDLTILMPTFTKSENDLYLAEAYIRLSENLDTASELINNTRVNDGGLSPAEADDLDLLDKVFYERYLEAYESPGGPFFDRRRTDDLGNKQFREFPIPALELNTLDIPLYTKGG